MEIDTLKTRIRALPPDRIQALVRPIGLLCMDHVLSTPSLPADVRETCEDVRLLLAADNRTEDQFLSAAYAATNAAAHAAYAAAHAAYATNATNAAAHAAYAAAFATNDTYAAFAVSQAAVYTALATGTRDQFLTQLTLLVG